MGWGAHRTTFPALRVANDFRSRATQTEGVKYDKLTVVLINAIKEQQQQIEKQSSQIAQLQRQIREIRTAQRLRNNRSMRHR